MLPSLDQKVIQNITLVEFDIFRKPTNLDSIRVLYNNN